MRIDSEAVLKSIEAQHGLFVERAKGIYSFSHLTFQEYFAAREIVATSAYKNLVKHLTEKRWREVFLLTISMMRSADDLLKLMKRKVDKIVEADEKLQQFLSWISYKLLLTATSPKLAINRVFYFVLEVFSAQEFRVDLIFSIDPGIHRILTNIYGFDYRGTYLVVHHYELALDLELVLDRELAIDFDLTCALNRTFRETERRDFDLPLNRVLERSLTPSLKYSIQQLRDQIPDLYGREFLTWRVIEGRAWVKKLRTVLIEHRNIGHDWQFSDGQKQLLEQYYDANKLLVDCLNSDCYVSRDVRQEIEDTLLLPMSEIVRDRTSPTY